MQQTLKLISCALLSSTLLWSAGVFARDVNISKNVPFVDTDYKDNLIRIERNQDNKHVLKGGFTKTSRNCPPFCIQPMQAALGVTTIGELEVIDFIAKDVKYKTGIVIDARTAGWHKKGTIPGSVNIPFTVFNKDEADPEFIETMISLGAKQQTASTQNSFWSWISSDNKSKSWDFTKAKDLVLWCNGMWCEQSPRAIHNLLKRGYPADKIKYYRGGMQTWLILGLTVVKP